MASQFKISGGPSKFDLMVSVFEGNPTPRKEVIFTVLTGVTSGPPGRQPAFTKPVEVAITSIEQEDGSGESWIFKGNAPTTTDRIRKASGYYSSKTRQGHIDFK